MVNMVTEETRKSNDYNYTGGVGGEGEGGDVIVVAVAAINPVNEFGKKDVSQISNPTTISISSNGQNKIQNEQYETGRSSSFTVISDLTSEEPSSQMSPSHGSSKRRSSSALRESQVIHDSKVMQRSLHHLGGSSSSNPLAKLPWEKVGLVGRQSQLSKIQETFQNGVLKGNGPTLISVSGPSGVGKSSLVQEALKSIKHLRNDNSVYSAIGKWSLTATDEPLSILQGIFNQIGEQIIESQDLEFVKHLTEEFDQGQNDMLEFWMPTMVQCCRQQRKEEGGTTNNNTASLSTTLGDDGSNRINDDDKEPDYYRSSAADDAARSYTLSQLRYATSTLLSLIHRPVVIIADDIQWADPTSLELLKSWCTDSTLKHVMIMVCYRSDEVNDNENDGDESHVVMKSLLTPLKDTRIDITVGPLTLDETLEVMTRLLNVEMESSTGTITSVETFAKLLHQSTGGNPFYLVSFIQSLVDDALLAFDLCKMKWTWNIDDVKEATSVTDNVVDMVKHTLTSSIEATSLLPIAAILGATFTERLLSEVCSLISTRNNLSSDEFGIKSLPELSSGEIKGWLHTCEENGFLFSISKKGGDTDDCSYKFVHDRIQEAALALLPPNKLSKLKLEIGGVLAQMVTDEMGMVKSASSDFLVFTAVNLLDDENAIKTREPVTSNMQSLSRLSLILLNQTAGDRSLSKSYFGLATKYFDTAVSLLEESDWQERSKLCATVYSGAALAGYGAGDSEWMTKYADIILAKDELQLLDKVPTYHMVIQYQLSTENNTEAINMTLELLGLLGVRFPKNGAVITFKTISGLLSSTKQLKDLDIQKLPVVGDEKENAIQKTLDVLASAAYHGKAELIPLAILKLFHRTRRYGLTRWSAPAFSLLGLLMAGGLEDFASTKTCYNLSLAAQKLVPSKEMEARLLFLNNQYLVHWFSSQQNILRPLNQGYRMGLLIGDIESSAWSICFYVEVSLISGRPLPLVHADCATYSSQMNEYSMTKQRRYMLWQWQVCRNLMGSDESVSRLSGDIVTQEEELATLRNNKDRAMELGLVRVRMFLAASIGDYQMCADLALDFVDECIKRLPAQTANARVRFNAALSGFIVAKSSPSRGKYRRLGIKNASIIRSWSRKGNPNCLHLDAFLDAEKARLDAKTNAAIKSYESAIVLAGRQGYLHDQALACERYADMLLELGWNDQALTQMRDAMKWYEEWGATYKVNRLESKIFALAEKTKTLF